MTAPLEMLKPVEACEYLKVSKMSLHRLVKARFIRPTRPRKGSRLVRYSRAELDRYITSHTKEAS
jgi:excisionase family DNA binding protein